MGVAQLNKAKKDRVQSMKDLVPYLGKTVKVIYKNLNKNVFSVVGEIDEILPYVHLSLTIRKYDASSSSSSFPFVEDSPGGGISEIRTLQGEVLYENKKNSEALEQMYSHDNYIMVRGADKFRNDAVADILFKETFGGEIGRFPKSSKLHGLRTGKYFIPGSGTIKPEIIRQDDQDIMV